MGRHKVVKIIGIYTIICKASNKIYIGYSTDIRKRLCTHKVKLRVNKHPNIYLQNAYNKYGEENFEFSLLLECDEQFLCSEENYWCNMLCSHNNDYGYNIDPTNPNQMRAIRSEQTKEKLRIANLGRPVSIETHLKIGKLSKGRKMSDESRLKMSIARKGIPSTGDKRIPVTQYTKDGVFIKEWKSAKEAAISLRTCSPSEISTICRIIAGTSNNKKSKNRKTAGGFKWKYKVN